MSSFAALLASVGKDGPVPDTSSPASKPPVSSSPAPKPKPKPKPKPGVLSNATKPVASSGVPTLKRKAEDGDPGARPKVAKTYASAVTSRPDQPTKPAGASTGSANPAAATAYKGTARGPVTTNPAASKPTQAPQVLNEKPTAISNNATKPGLAPTPAPKKGGFAATLARAAAAQQAAKATGGNNIVHKPAEKLSKRERERQRAAQEAAEKEKQKAGGPKGKMAQQAGRSRSGTPGDGKAGSQQKKGPVDVGYKGTMRKATPLSYSGTMRASDPARPPKPVKQKDKFGGQDKYGGYASWSDLSDAQDDEEDYMSDESDDMEGGFDEMEREEAAASRAGRKEDQEALAEEERLKKEKMDRKRRLEAMAKQASSKKRF